MKKKASNKPPECVQLVRAIRDAQDLLNGKWKIHILSSLLFRGPQRFMDLAREVEGIAPKMLSKELKELEMNHLVSRTILDTQPISVEYALTVHGRSLESFIKEMAHWSMTYRARMMKTGRLAAAR
jgi:DNA-binding HxlR family transcriptional regulator